MEPDPAAATPPPSPAPAASPPPPSPAPAAPPPPPRQPQDDAVECAADPSSPDRCAAAAGGDLDSALPLPPAPLQPTDDAECVADPLNPDRCAAAAGGDLDSALPLPPAPLQPADDAVECEDPSSPDRCATSAVEDLDPAPPLSPAPLQPTVEDATPNGNSEQEQKKEAVAGVGEAPRSFIEKLGDQGDDFLILSSKLEEIVTPERPAALCLLGEKYNKFIERYKQQVAKCAEECAPRYDRLEKMYNQQVAKCANECAPRYDGLKKKYTDECAERRRLYNELIELRGNIRVFCRCRPLSSAEVTRGCLSIVEIDPSKETELQFIPTEKERKTFKFDYVFGPEEGQEAVFSETVPVVRSVMDGFNVCIFAYGQTGAGKTFTMEGIPENRGVNYRALKELFRMSEERSESITYTFSVSILEVYNEKIRDLLDESNEQPKRLDIKQSADGTQEVPGLVDAPVYNIDGVWEKLKFGARNRSVGSTNANELSSRSHSLVRVTVTSLHLVTGQRSRSHMWLVDLAGSERVAKTGVEGDRLKESQFINKSLSALGDVISALASKNSHIPYRNSKLTHLLQSSLGGDCKTLMFVQISPSSTESAETLCSLNFATRVRAVEHGPARKQVDPTENLKLKQMTEKLRHEEKENAQLSQSLQLMQLKYASRENVFKTLNEKVRDAEQACKNYQQRIRELEIELGNEKKAARDSARSSRPPLVPMRQRQPQGRNNNYAPPSGPSRSRFSKPPTVNNKENIPVTVNKACPGSDPKAVGKARRVSISMTPVIRQIPIQPKKRFSMATLPSVSEHLPVFNGQRAASRPSLVNLPKQPLAGFGLILGTPLATPDGAKFRRMEFGSSSKFTSPPPMPSLRNKMATPQQQLGMAPAEGPGNAARMCFSIHKRVGLSPVRAKPCVPSGVGIFNPSQHGRTGKAMRVLNTKRRQSVI